MATKGRSMKGERGRQVRQPRGSRHWNAKLTEDDVRRLRAERAAGVTLADLHARTGLSKGALSMLLRGKTWTHVT
jgi:hypothetical protein